MIRVAAVGDLHVAADGVPQWRRALRPVSVQADVLLLAGDLTQTGREAETHALLETLDVVSIPIVAVLGNHDYHADRQEHLRETLVGRGVTVLEGGAVVLAVGDVRLGVVGTKGFGGGFADACGTDFGEPEMKAFVGHTRRLSERLAAALGSLEADVRIVLLHYAPVPDTIEGERREIYPFLGSHLLAQAIDEEGADLVVHGHAHAGTEAGATPAGIPVRNVAQPVIRAGYRLFELTGSAPVASPPGDAAPPTLE